LWRCSIFIYQQVKKGTEIILRPVALPVSPRIPFLISCVITCLLTAFVGLCSAFVVYITKSHFSTQAGWAFCAVTLLIVWLFVGYCWYRIFTEKPPAMPVIAQEQPEGVWPPAPLITVEEDNKD
jgi:hypothetical protein